MNFSVPTTPAERTFYYRNKKGKVVSLSEEIAFEQHDKHAQFLGCSEDLKRTGYNQLEAIAKHFEDNVDNPTSPRDMRKMRFDKGSGKYVPLQDAQQAQQLNTRQLAQWAKNNKGLLKQILNEDNQEQKTKMEGVRGENDKTQKGRTQ